MKHNKIHSIVNSTALLGLIVAGILYITSEKQTKVYVDNVQLFNEFNMTKDIKRFEEKKINDKAKQLDSVYRVLQSEKDKESNQAKKQILFLNNGRDELERLKSNYQDNLSQNVWNRLNMYLTEYAKNEDIDIVFGANGNGNVMYASEGLNITDKVLAFSNAKYEGN